MRGPRCLFKTKQWQDRIRNMHGAFLSKQETIQILMNIHTEPFLNLLPIGTWNTCLLGIHIAIQNGNSKVCSFRVGWLWVICGAYKNGLRAQWLQQRRNQQLRVWVGRTVDWSVVAAAPGWTEAKERIAQMHTPATQAVDDFAGKSERARRCNQIWRREKSGTILQTIMNEPEIPELKADDIRTNEQYLAAVEACQRNWTQWQAYKMNILIIVMMWTIKSRRVSKIWWRGARWQNFGKHQRWRFLNS